jgi:hypothetical protein
MVVGALLKSLWNGGTVRNPRRYRPASGDAPQRPHDRLHDGATGGRELSGPHAPMAGNAPPPIMMPFVPWSPARATGDPADTAALLARLAAGDRRALERLYRREADPVYRYALALCGNAAWAADATQDAFIALATRPQGFDAAQGTLGAYLAGIARNALRTRLHRARRRLAALLHAAAGEGP